MSTTSIRTPRVNLIDALIQTGFQKHYILRSLSVYEKHYNVLHIGYNIPILTEIIFRIKLKDTLKESEITFHSKVNLFHILESIGFSKHNIRSAIETYENEQSQESFTYNVKIIAKITMEIRAKQFRQLNTTQHHSYDSQDSVDTKNSSTMNNISLNNYADAEMFYKNKNLTHFQATQHTNWKDLRSLRHKPVKLKLPQGAARISTYNSYEKLQLHLNIANSELTEQSEYPSKQIETKSNISFTPMPTPSLGSHTQKTPVPAPCGSLNGYDLLMSDCNALMSICKYRHCILMWFPLVDTITDILTILLYFKSQSYALFVYGLVSCVVLWLVIRLQSILLILYHVNIEKHQSVANVLLMYIPFITPFGLILSVLIKWIKHKRYIHIGLKIIGYLCSVVVAISGCVMIEVVLLIGIMIYPFAYTYYAMMAFLTITGCSLRNTHYLHLNDAFDEYYEENHYEQQRVLKLTDLGLIIFMNESQNIFQSLPQFILQIYVYFAIDYAHYLILWLFLVSVIISGCNVIRIVFRISYNGYTLWSNRYKVQNEIQ